MQSRGPLGPGKFHVVVLVIIKRENIEVEGIQNSLFPAGPVIKWLVILSNTKVEKTAKKSFTLRRLTHEFAAVSRSTT